MRLCHGCLCELRDGIIPLCEGCFADVLSLPLNDRLPRIAEITKAMREQEFHDSFVFEFARFVDVLNDARQDSSNDSQDWWKDGPDGNTD